MAKKQLGLDSMGIQKTMRLKDYLGLTRGGELDIFKLYRQLSAAYLDAMRNCAGWCHWTWRIHADDVAKDCWDAGKAINNGWLKLG